MAKNELCKNCGLECGKDETCAAINKLCHIYQEERTKEKAALIKSLRSELNLFDCEPSEEMRTLAEKIIDKIDEVAYIREYDFKTGYVLSYERKKKDGGLVFGECRKVSGAYQAYLPYDFIITFYEPNIDILNDNQKKIVMLHELKHEWIGPRGLTIRPHDREDFLSILEKHGLYWGDFGNDEVPDILAGDIDETESKGKSRSKKK